MGSKKNENPEPIIGRLGLLDETLNAGSPAKDAILKALTSQDQVAEAKRKKAEAEAALSAANKALDDALSGLSVAQTDKIYLVGGRAVRVIAKDIHQKYSDYEGALYDDGYNDLRETQECYYTNYDNDWESRPPRRRPVGHKPKKYSLEVIEIAE